MLVEVAAARQKAIFPETSGGANNFTLIRGRYASYSCYIANKQAAIGDQAATSVMDAVLY